MKLIQTQTLATAAAQIEFTSLPQDGTDLLLVSSLRSVSTEDGVFVRFNGTSSGYSQRTLFGNGSAALTTLNPYGITSALFLATIPGTSWTSNTFHSARLYLPNYAGSTNKSTSLDGVGENNATLNYLDLGGGLWSNTAAITSILIYTNSTSNMAVGSTVSLYKITKGSNGIVTTSP
jgi:hypothetical protein